MEKGEKLAGQILLWTEILSIGGFLVFSGYQALETTPPPTPPVIVPQVQPDRVVESLKLKRGDFNVYRYLPGQAEFATHPLAVIIFESGDGGFLGWEDRVSRYLQAAGYEVLGIDSALYANTDYDLDTLQADINTIAQNSIVHYGNHPPPLIMAGWSMGAEQAVPAAGGPHPPLDLVGLLLISPGNRGRYGLRMSDKLDITPTGVGTYGLQDFSHSLDKVRVAQWNANLDLLGSKKWLNSLTAVHKAYDFPWGMHDYNGASDQFLQLLKESLDWLLSSQQP